MNKAPSARGVALTTASSVGVFELTVLESTPAVDVEDDVWVENIPYDQTRAYVKRVQRSLHVYERFYR